MLMGDICILIGGLKMEELLPKAGKPHWGSGRQFWVGTSVCKNQTGSSPTVCIPQD